jgi:hypothetical protein
LPGDRLMNYFRVDLKVCEGCGALWLRASGRANERLGVYCHGCAVRLSDFPAPRFSRRGRKRAAAAAGGGGER